MRSNKDFVKSILTGMVIGVVFVAGKYVGYGDMYNKMMGNIAKATAQSCEYVMPVEDRKLSFEDATKAAIYRAMTALEGEAKKERPW
jgi:TRAP-type mannitol/chloroaromatic compound transport system substrate-binding protein